MSVCRYCGAEIDWMPTEDGRYVPIDPEPVLVIEGEGDERFYSEEEGILVGRQAAFEEESPELPVGFVRHRRTCMCAYKLTQRRAERGAGHG